MFGDAPQLFAPATAAAQDLYRPALRLPKAVQPTQILTQFQTGHGYTTNGSGLASSSLNDTADFIRGTQSAKITTAGNGSTANLDKFAQPAFSLAGGVLRITLKVDDITHLANINVFLGTSSLANNYRWRVQTTSPSTTNWIQSGEWLTVTLSWASIGTATGTFTYTNGAPSVRTGFTDVRVQVNDDNTGNAVTVHCQSIEIIPDGSAVFPNGVVSITFDDAWDSVYSYARPRMDLYGYGGTNYVITSHVGTAGRLTLPQLLTLQDHSGWEIAAHAFSDTNHQLGDTGMTAAVLDSDARSQKAWLVRNGFRGEGHAYPLGRFGLTTDSVPTLDILRKYWAYCRTILYADLKETFPPANPFRLRAISGVSSVGTGDQLPSNIVATGGVLDKCKTNQSWTIFAFHKIVTSGVTVTTECLQSDFNAIIDAVNTKGIPVLPVGDVLRYYG